MVPPTAERCCALRRLLPPTQSEPYRLDLLRNFVLNCALPLAPGRRGTDVWASPRKLLLAALLCLAWAGPSRAGYDDAKLEFRGLSYDDRILVQVPPGRV